MMEATRMSSMNNGESGLARGGSIPSRFSFGTSSENSIGSFRDRHDAIRHASDNLVEDLLNENGALRNKLYQVILERENDNRHSQCFSIQEKEIFQSRLNRFQSMMERNQFVLVLLDGDGMIFEDNFICDGEQGGKDAANQLDAAIRSYTLNNLPHAKGAKIITRVYANVKGLAEACTRSGLIENPSVVQEFVRGFNESKLLFDFIDVGVGKDRADGKIAELFKHHLDELNCHQIFLGGSHDNGYARILEESISRDEHREKITLLEGVPFERELQELTRYFHHSKFPNIFRDTKIAVNHQTWAAVRPLKTISPNLPSSSLPVRQHSPSPIEPPPTSTKPNWASMAAKPFVPSVPSDSASSPTPSTSIVATKPIKTNRYGQRIDPLDKTLPSFEVNRIKKMKLCNVHYLLGECYRNPCSHDHSYKLSQADKKTLGFVARMTPCHYRTECDDPKCIYGHRCPQNDPKKGDCFFKEDCHFWGWGHGIDEEVVKTTKV